MRSVMTDADAASARLRGIVRAADAALRGISQRERLARRIAMHLS